MSDNLKHSDYTFLKLNIKEFKETEDSFSKQAALVYEALLQCAPDNEFLTKAASYFKIIADTSGIWAPFFNTHNNEPQADFFEQLNTVLGSPNTNINFLARFTACGWLVKNYLALQAQLAEILEDKNLRSKIESNLRTKGCNLGLEQLIVTPVQRLMRYPMFAQEWAARHQKLDDQNPTKTAAFSLYRKFKRLASYMNGLEKAMAVQNEQKKNRHWSERFFDLFIPDENLVDSVFLAPSFANALEFSFISNKQEEKQSVKPIFEENDEVDLHLANDAMTQTESNPSPRFDTEDSTLIANLKALNAEMRASLVQKTLSALKADLVDDSQSKRQFKQIFRYQIKVDELSEQQFLAFLSLIQLTHDFLKDQNQDSFNALIDELEDFEKSLTTVNPARATAYILISISLIIMTAVLLNPTFLAVGGSFSLAMAVLGAITGAAALATVSCGVSEAFETFLPIKQGFFGITKEVRDLVEENTVELETNDYKLK